MTKTAESWSQDILDKVNFHYVVSIGLTQHPKKALEHVYVKFDQKTVVTKFTERDLFEYFDKYGLSDNSAKNLVSLILADCDRVLASQADRSTLLDDVVFA